VTRRNEPTSGDSKNISRTVVQKDEEFRLLLPRGNYTVRFSYVQDKTPQIHDVAISIPRFLPPLEIKRDLILSEIPKVK
jgi:hypothetical protein